MSRPTQPTALKIIAGNPGRRPLPEDEPAVIAIEDAEPPEDLIGDDARGKWAELIVILSRMRVLSASDLNALRLICQCHEDMCRGQDLVRKNGYVVEGASGQMVRNPAQAVVENARKDMMKGLTQFGMTPSSRAGVATIPNVGAADGWEDI